MIKNFKKITSILLLLVFILPSIEKLEHHHEHFNHNVETDKHYPEFSENCYICDFEFSVFSSDFESLNLPKGQHVDSYYNSYRSFNSTLLLHSFLLRGPPQSFLSNITSLRG